MRRILFQETDFNSLPNPPAGFKYIGFDGPEFSQMGEDGQINPSVGATGPQGPTGPAGSGGSASSDRLISSNVAYNLEAILDENGTLNTPLLLPLSFTAVCDDNHYDGTASFTDNNWWDFQVQFQVNPDGTVETMIDNIFPILTNPGYVSGDVFIFTESDHGIPGFNFELQLNDVVFTGGVHWTANLTVTPPPVYPSTIESLGALKFTSNSNSLVLGTDGDLILPGGMEVGGVSVSTDGSETILEKRLEETETDGIVTITNAVGSKLTFNYNSIGMESYTDPDGPNNTSLGRVLVGPGVVEILSLEENLGGDATTGILVGPGGIQISTNDGVTTQTISVGGGVINLPEGGDILDYLGNSVLSGISMTEVTYSELLDLVNSSSLIPGRYYKILDYKTCYDQPDYDIYGNAITSGNYKEGSNYPIIVFAISENSLSVDAWQPEFPKDKIKYDISWTQSEHTGGTAYGRITERIDEWNNRTDYDHRDVLFKRYDTHVFDMNNPQVGTISVSNGVVTGVDTLFTNFSVGNIVAIPNFSETFFRIDTITSATAMSLTGSVWDVTANDIKYYAIDYLMESGSPKKSNVEFDHYEVTTFGNAIANNGASNNYIGDHAYSYILYGVGNFILSNNVFLTGVYNNNKFGNGCYNNTFNDDCTNNTIGHYFINNITDDDFDGNQISNYFENNIITANFQRNFVGENFRDNTIVNGDFYRNRIGEQFENNKISGGEFQNNVIGNAFRYNIVRTTGVGFLKNVIGVGFNGNDIWGGEFNSNKIGNGMNNNTLYCDFYENKIGDYFETNTIGSESSIAYFYQNNIDNDFDTNQIYASFHDNNVGINAYNNNFYNFTFDNNIGINFENNTIGTSNNIGGFDFEKNTIGIWCKGNFFIGSIDSNEFGNYFWSNEILDSSYANKIGSDFQNNDVYSEFNFNTIANSCQNNTFGTGSRYNILGGDFQENVIGTEFEYNNIGSEFNNNNIGNYFKNNSIGNFFELNTISYDFKQNSIGNFFNDNSISFNFAYNVIGDSFYGNTIENDFGFGGGQSRGNKIGNYFYNNSIGEYFYDNIIADLFNNNTIGDYFMLNHVKASDIYNIDFTLNYGNILSFTDNTGASPSIPGTDNIYIGLTCSDGQGVEATFDVTVSGSVVTNVAIANSGRLYLSGDSLTIIGSKFGGTDGQDIIMTVTTVSATPSVYGSYNSNIFRNSNGNNRLSYYDGDDVLTITNIDE